MAGPIRIGCGAGFWGDTPEGAVQLVKTGAIDVLVLDYLAEITMSILARMKAKRPELGYAGDFVTHVMAPLAAEIAARGIKVVTNAGGLNPAACRDALEAVCREAGAGLKVAIVTGDDLAGEVDWLRTRDVREMFSGAPFPKDVASANAYLGATPIALALEAGADIVVTGRVADSALALGALIHAFGWREDDYDRLAAGSLVGHVLECGAQATGGLFTDWREVDGWERMGFPIAECAADGTFVLTKPVGTGGLVSPASVAEQIIYEVGDPATYVLPDVVADFSAVRLATDGPDRVAISGAKGRAPTDTYKVSVTYADGYRASATMTIAGLEAAARAQRVGEAILARASRFVAEAGHAPFDETLIEVLGADVAYGADPRTHAAREVVLRIGTRHHDRSALAIFAREIYPAATAMAQGITGFAGGRPAPQPVVRLFSCLVPKGDVAVSVDAGAGPVPVEITPGMPLPAPRAAEASPGDGDGDGDGGPGRTLPLPLIALAHGRSGDKGDSANIGILARHPQFVPVLRARLTAERVAAALAHFVAGPVTRYEWPGLDGFNFVAERALGGGGVASLRNDPQGKGFSQVLLDIPIDVPIRLIEAHPALARWARPLEAVE